MEFLFICKYYNLLIVDYDASTQFSAWHAEDSLAHAR